MLSKTQTRIAGLVISIIWIGIFSFILEPESNTAKLWFDMNTDIFLYPFTIQNIMWVMFFVSLGELYYRFILSKENVIALDSKYLNEKPSEFYDTTDLVKVMKKINPKNDSLSKLIKSLFTRYQASQKSPDETHQMLNSQLEMMQYKLDVDYNIIRYLAWLIPTLGFIGTVIGINGALAYAGIPGNATQDSFLPELTSRLAVAFDTTLVALVMSAFVVYLLHLMQGREDNIIQKCGEYCLNNFINKLISK